MWKHFGCFKKNKIWELGKGLSQYFLLCKHEDLSLDSQRPYEEAEPHSEQRRPPDPRRSGRLTHTGKGGGGGEKARCPTAGPQREFTQQERTDHHKATPDTLCIHDTCTTSLSTNVLRKKIKVDSEIH